MRLSQSLFCSFTHQLLRIFFSFMFFFITTTLHHLSRDKLKSVYIIYCKTKINEQDTKVLQLVQYKQIEENSAVIYYDF